MKRFSAAKNKWDAIKTALLPVVINTGLMFLFLMMAAVVLAQSQRTGEIQFLVFIFEKVEPWFHPFCVIGFFALFISTSEGLLHWGGSFVSIDLLDRYFKWPKKQTAKTTVGILSMLLIAGCSVSIAYYSQSLFSLVKLMLSISAGVAPVYILRWIWMRINAWSQLSAMLTSGITTIIVQPYYSHLGFPWQLIIITLITSFGWLIVTWITPEDNPSVIQQFSERVPSPRSILSSIGVALLAGFAFLMLIVLGVYLLFY